MIQGRILTREKGLIEDRTFINFGTGKKKEKISRNNNGRKKERYVPQRRNRFPSSPVRLIRWSNRELRDTRNSIFHGIIYCLFKILYAVGGLGKKTIKRCQIKIKMLIHRYALERAVRNLEPHITLGSAKLGLTKTRLQPKAKPQTHNLRFRQYKQCCYIPTHILCNTGKRFLQLENSRLSRQ